MKYFKRYYMLVKKFRFQILIAVILAAVTSLGNVIFPRMIGTLVDHIKNATLTVAVMKDLLLKLLSLAIAIYIANIIWGYYIFRNFYYVKAKLSVDILKKALRQSPLFLKKNPISEIINKTSSDSGKVGEVVGYGLMTLVDGVVFPVFIFVAMSKISVLLTLISVIALPIMVYIITEISKKYDPAYEAFQKSLDSLNENAIEDFSAIKVVKSFVIEENKKEIFLKKVDDSLSKELYTTKLAAYYNPVTEIGIGFFSIISFVVGAKLIHNGTISYGDLITFSMYLLFLTWPAYALSDMIIVFKEGNASIKRIDKLLYYEDDFKNYNATKTVARVDKIELKDFSFQYPGNDKFELKDINMTFERGKKYGIVGKTGSGKTTILRQLINEYPDFSGKILINGIDVKDLNLISLKKKVGYVPQEHFLYSKTIRENIEFYRPLTDNEVEKVILASDFKKDLQNLPKGIHTLSGEQGISLSGGQKQRISLARALAKKVDILVLDDVLSAVDNSTQNKILENLNEEFADNIVVMSSHKINAVKNFDMIFVLDNGKIVESGNFDRLMENRGWFYEQAVIQEVTHEKR